MTSTKPVEERSDPKPIGPPVQTSERPQYATMSSSVSPPMSPSAFSSLSPTTSSSEARPSKSFSLSNPFQPRSITRAATTDSIFRSMSKSARKPPPNSITTTPGQSTSPTLPTSQPMRIGSEPTISPTTPSHPASPSRPTTFKKMRKTSGTTSHCGRHSNEWLFGGISVRETVKGMWKDGDGQDR